VADLLVVTAGVLLLIFAGVLFGIFLHAINRWLVDHTPLSYRIAHSLLILALVLLILASSYYTGSQIVEQIRQLSEQLRSAGQRVLDRVTHEVASAGSAPVEKAVTTGVQALSGMSLAFQWVTWALTGAIVIFFVGLYVAFDPELYTTGIIKLFPVDRRPRAEEVISRLRPALEKWIIGRLISMSIIGVCTAVALGFLNVPLAVPLGVLSGLLTFVPNIGAVVAVVPQALMALQVSSQAVGLVIVLNFVLQVFESYLITPLIERQQVHLPPALTIAVQLLLGATLGIIGIMMAAPLTVVTMLVVQLLYVRDTLGDADPGELASETEGAER
jgi:predicted PurR-regulated permease PerM